MRRWLLTAGMAACMALTAPGLAGPTGGAAGSVLSAQEPGQEHRDRAELADRVWERFYERARERIDLSDEEFDELRRLLKDFREPRVELYRERRELRKEKARITEAPSETVEDEARRLVERRAELRVREERLEHEEEQELLELLGPQRLLEFQEVRERLNQKVKKLQLCDDRRDRGSSRR